MVNLRLSAKWFQKVENRTGGKKESFLPPPHVKISKKKLSFGLNSNLQKKSKITT